MGYVLGVDVGGTKILIGKVFPDGSIRDEKRYDSKRGTQESAVNAVMAAVRDYINGLDFSEKPSAVGMGLVGQVNYREGIWMHSLATPISTPFPICSILQSETGIPFFADNDVHCATIAEMKFGVGKHTDNFVYINIGTGIAAGLVSEGTLIRGFRNIAGEVGHMSVDMDMDFECKCGRRGCTESFASGGGMIRYARSLFAEYPDSVLVKYDNEGKLFSSTIFSAADQKDPLACHVADLVLRSTVSMFQDIINLMDPGEIVVGGGVFNGNWLLPKVIERLRPWFSTPQSDLAARISVSSLDPSKVGLLGAASFAMQMSGL